MGFSSTTSKNFLSYLLQKKYRHDNPTATSEHITHYGEQREKQEVHLRFASALDSALVSSVSSESSDSRDRVALSDSFSFLRNFLLVTSQTHGQRRVGKRCVC